MSEKPFVDWDAVADVLLVCVSKLIDQEFGPLRERMAVLEAKVAALAGDAPPAKAAPKSRRKAAAP